MGGRFIGIVALLISLPFGTRAQNTITTVAGGVPNNIAALSVGLEPQGIFKDASGNSYITDAFCYCVYKVASNGQLTTVAGNGTSGFSGDGGPATIAELGGPSGVFVDSVGNIYIADDGNERIREVVAATGIIQTVAGNGTEGFSGDGGPATSAELNGPTGVFLDSAGNIFIADDGNNRIREVTAGTGIIQTVAGNGTAGFSGDNGPSTSAEINHPFGVFVNSTGNIFIADTLNARIREVVSGNIQTIAGNGTAGFSGDGAATSVELAFPSGVFVDGAGNIFIDDDENQRIREIATGTDTIRTVVGNGTPGFAGDGGAATSAELNDPLSVFVDTSGNILIADVQNGRIREVASATGAIQTVAGNGLFEFSGDGGPATSAQLDYPYAVAVDKAGNLYIADSGNSRIREVVAATGVIQTVAGNGSYGFSGDGGPATSAKLTNPTGVAVDGSGNIFIADVANNRVREVVAATGIIQTVAGNGTFGFSGDGGPATSAELADPIGVAVDGSGNVFFVDTGNNRVREVVAATGVIQTVAGNGTGGFSGDGGPARSAEISVNSCPGAGVYVDAAGNLFIADTDNYRVREVVDATGIIQTVAEGTGEGDNGVVSGVFEDDAGNIFFSEPFMNSIGEVLAATGVTQTVAGNGTEGFSGDGGPATSAELYTQIGLVGDASGNLFIADTYNNRIRKVTGLVSIPALSIAPSSLTFTTAGSSQNITLTNNGTAPLAITAIAFTGTNPGDFAFGSGTTCPTTGGNLSSSGSCTLSVTFQPTAVGTRTASVTITDNASGGPQSVSLTGTTTPGLSLSTSNLTFTALGASQNVTLTNNGTGLLTIGGIAITGTNAGDFAFGSATTCPTTGGNLASNASCTLNVTFQPLAGGTRSASITITDNASGSPQSVTLTGTSQSAVGISISSPTAPVTVNTGLSFQFTAAVTGTTNTAVTWQVNGIAGGNATFGAISASGLYTAPAAVPTPASFNVTVVSVADPTKSASVMVTVALASSSSPLSVQISPQPASVVVGSSTVQFGAVVLNAGTDTGVTWSVVSGPGTGSINASTGVYTPPATPPSGNVTIQATSIANPNISQQISFSIAQQALAFAPGQPTTVPPLSPSSGSSSANLVLSMGPSASGGTFNLTCDQMPPGAACSVKPTTVTVQTGQTSLPFTLTVVASVSSSRFVMPMLGGPTRPWLLLGVLIVGSLAAAMWIVTVPIKRTGFACLLLVLVVCFSLAFLTACSGISATSVSSPVVSSVKAGSVIPARVTATPVNTTGNFTATQMIIPFPVQ